MEPKGLEVARKDKNTFKEEKKERKEEELRQEYM